MHEVDVSEEFAKVFEEMNHKDYLVNRKETRRHCSYDGILELGIQFADKRILVEDEAIHNLEAENLYSVMKILTERQKTILTLYAVYELSFREIGERFALHKDTVREHYWAAVKKMKKCLQATPSNCVLSGC